MATLSLKRRIERLEKAKATPKVIGIIPGFELVENPDRPGHLMRPEPPGGFEAAVKIQQRKLLAECSQLAACLPDDPDPVHVGRSNEKAAPLKPGQVRKPPPRFKFEKRRIRGKWREFQIDTQTGETVELK